MTTFQDENKRDWVLIACIIIFLGILIWNKHGNRTERDNGQRIEQVAE